VVGISFGGMVALELAVTVPARIERLALLCTSAGGAGGSSFPLHELAGPDSAGRLARRPTLLDSRFDQRWLDTHPSDRRLVAMMVARAPAPDQPRAQGYREQLEARRTHDTWDRLPSITCPTFVGCGRYDGIAPMRNSEALASRLPHAELHVYEGGHTFLAQAPESVGDVTGFLLDG
jgi:pimeloyl-ACP methyl ester carboxylesterase